MYIKNFDSWNRKKKDLDSAVPFSQREQAVYFYEREIWWAFFGENVGYEMCGKGREKTRPVLVIKKCGKDSAIVVPLTTKLREKSFLISIGSIDGKESSVNITQMCMLDARRFSEKIGMCHKVEHDRVKEKTREFFS